MRKLFFILLLLISTRLLAQEAKAEEKPEAKWFASLTGAVIPFPQWDIGIQPGIAYRINDRFSLLTEITIRVGNKNSPKSEAFNKKYFRVQPELRYNLSGKKKDRNMYAGLRLSYSLRKFTDENGFYSNNNAGDEGFFYDKAAINSPVFTSSIQFGSLFSAGKKISIDAFAGAGARFINTAFANIINPISGVRVKEDGPSINASYSYEGSLIRLQLNAGLRLIYHFKP
jgi:hypothetical protein